MLWEEDEVKAALSLDVHVSVVTGTMNVFREMLCAACPEAQEFYGEEESLEKGDSTVFT